MWWFGECLKRWNADGALIPGRLEASRGNVTVANERTSPGLLQTVLPEMRVWVASRVPRTSWLLAPAPKGRYRIEVSIGGMEAISPDFVVADQGLFAITAEAVVNYFRLMRYVKAADHHLRVWGTKDYVDAWGGWKDAGGDNGKLKEGDFVATPRVTGLSPWYGGNYNVWLFTDRLTTQNIFTPLSPQYSTSLNASYTQPLLRNRAIDEPRRRVIVARKSGRSAATAAMIASPQAARTTRISMMLSVTASERIDTAIMESPILGAEGNKEFLLYAHH